MRRGLKVAAMLVLGLVLLTWLGPADETLHRVQGRAKLEMSPAEAWARLRRFDTAHHYVPGVAGTEITTTTREGVGASRRVTMEVGGALEETITHWDEGRGFRLRLHQGDAAPFPFTGAEYIYELRPLPDGRVEIFCEMNYRLAGGLPVRLLHELGIGAFIAANHERIIANLKEYYESSDGAPVR
jgi:hypothetical protein